MKKKYGSQRIVKTQDGGRFDEKKLFNGKHHYSFVYSLN